MKKIPRVSIVIPVKGGKLLMEALDSVIKQTYQDWECIIVDDGIDSTIKDKVLDLLSSDSRFYLIESEGKGISDALNTGIKCARGELISRLDDDDKWYTYHLDLLTYILNNNNSNLDIVGSMVDIEWQPRITPSNISVFNPYRDLVNRNPFNHPAVVFRKKAFEKLEQGYRSECNGFEDYELWSRLLTEHNSLVINSATMYYNVSSVDKEKWWFEYLVFRHELCKRFSKEFGRKFYVEQVIYND